jgi:hypothetical protein
MLGPSLVTQAILLIYSFYSYFDLRLAALSRGPGQLNAMAFQPTLFFWISPI